MRGILGSIDINIFTYLKNFLLSSSAHIDIPSPSKKFLPGLREPAPGQDAVSLNLGPIVSRNSVECIAAHHFLSLFLSPPHVWKIKRWRGITVYVQRLRKLNGRERGSGVKISATIVISLSVPD